MPAVSRRRVPASLVRITLLAVPVVACLAVPAAARADDPAAADALARERAAGRALERGLSWLATDWERGGLDAAKDADALGRGNVAAASLAGLAFLQDGAEPDKGRYGLALRKCLDFVTAHADPKTGLISNGPSAPMYNHGFATFFLAEAYARTNDPQTKRVLGHAVRLIEKSQSTQGGWRYLPIVEDADSSVTSCQVVALLAARKAGLDVDDKVVERGLKYLRSCQNEDGGFRYMPAAAGSGVPRTAAAVAAFSAAAGQAGAPARDDYDRAMNYLAAQATPPAARGGPERPQPFFYYGNYYLAHAMRHEPNRDAKTRRFAPVRDAVVARQREDGSWSDEISPEYATASAVFVLGAPDSRLNVFRQGNDGHTGKAKTD